MESHPWQGISVKWTCPAPANAVVAGTLYYLLCLDPAVPKVLAGLVAVVALRCIRVTRAV
ncbi:hypothetical protein ACIQWR_39740 [Streptomyces sp. NPDC098789]|uniref:hypothetical protein n=1 Tax=Streptomyces sp. NPDC098789 TaxID=3366098 RepID=UPI003819FC66